MRRTRCERLESGVRWESFTLSSAWLLANGLLSFHACRNWTQSGSDPVEILNAAMLVKSGMNNNYSKSHEA